MIVLPAIDLYDGKVVRLMKGDFAQKTAYEGDPCEVARRFRDLGCTYIHVVDLEGAECGSPKHLPVLTQIRALGMRVEYGGGLRSKEAVAAAVDAGADRIMVGSLLFKTPEMPQVLFDDFGVSITPSIDVKSGYVAVSGWRETTAQRPEDCVRALYEIGFRAFLATATEHDGMLKGPDFGLYERIRYKDAYLIAAGGVTTAQNIRDLMRTGVSAAVVGKALYETGFNLAEALKITNEADEK